MIANQKCASATKNLPMSRMPSINAVLTGHLSTYTVIKELHRASDEAAVYLARQVFVTLTRLYKQSQLNGYRNQSHEKCIIKSIQGHWRLQNEADVLKRYQSHTPFLRPLVDEI
ncbi:hypothetical protein F5Y12DRAFT_456421 [Xylaria sp. FL1777]|nr:hypothetical protein F5Y12DRAFT_456421 [Xylaria sp. FL1777]